MKIRTFYFMVFIFFIFIGHQVFAENLVLNDIQNAEVGSTIEFTLTMNDAPNEVKAFGFEIAYNSDILSYQSYELAQEFQNRLDYFDDNKKSDGIIIFGGYSSGKKIEKNENGLLLTLSFTVLKSDNGMVSLQSLIDNFKGWSIKNGRFNQESVGFEDINNDGKLGLAEVIYLLQIVTGIN